MSANGSASTTSSAASTPATASTVSSGPKTSSRSSAESGGRSAATAGGQNQPAPGTSRGAVSSRPSRGGELAVAVDPLRASRSISGGTSVAKSSAWPTTSVSAAPASRSSSASAIASWASTRARRRALLAGVAEGRGDDRRDRVVEVGVGVDDDAVLAAHLGDHPLDVVLALRRLGGGADDLEPDRARAGERDQVHARVAHQRRAGLAEPGQQAERVGRHAGAVQRLDQHQRARRATARPA